MKKRKVNALLAIVLSLTMLVGNGSAVSIEGNSRTFIYYKCTGYINTGAK
ncbi:Uncharacterised protein [Dorea longicatena]|nr:Uncharacterised protein [Dorea longicatena]